MENKLSRFLILCLIASIFFAGCKNIAFLKDKQKYKAEQETEMSKISGAAYTPAELNLASEYLAALSIYLTEKKTTEAKAKIKNEYLPIIDCDPEFDQISPWSMHILSLFDAQSATPEPAEMTDCSSTKEKLALCKEQFKSFCNSSLHKELLQTFK
jgi:hypothetical protein